MFYALVRMEDARPKVVDDLKRTNEELQQKLTRLRAERDRLRTDVQQLVRMPWAPRGIRCFFSRRRFFLGRGITVPRRWAAGRCG
ncbi:hypothetical protein [Streptomyces sp. TLI_185]|uniref:hypothetical protein n=1 Tax=Streptomyces sp. TLI_185 TaxID=2485151 RepID=UPI000F4E9FCB|nr:hypothetical protein [Streptomyces sp. TLI_185]